MHESARAHASLAWTTCHASCVRHRARKSMRSGARVWRARSRDGTRVFILFCRYCQHIVNILSTGVYLYALFRLPDERSVFAVVYATTLPLVRRVSTTQNLTVARHPSFSFACVRIQRMMPELFVFSFKLMLPFPISPVAFGLCFWHCCISERLVFHVFNTRNVSEKHVKCRLIQARAPAAYNVSQPNVCCLTPFPSSSHPMG